MEPKEAEQPCEEFISNTTVILNGINSILVFLFLLSLFSMKKKNTVTRAIRQLYLDIEGQSVQ